MTEQEFVVLFRKAQNITFDFAKRFVLNDLEAKFRFDISFNEPKDHSGLKQFGYHLEDDNKNFKNLNEKEVVHLLFRNKKVPVWIDINVKTVRNTYTIMNLICAGRFSDDNSQYYYKSRKMGPFGIKSPALPIGFKDGDKFKI